MSWRSPDWLLGSSKPCSHMRAYGEGLTAAVWVPLNHVIHRVHADSMSMIPFSYEFGRKRKGGNYLICFIMLGYANASAGRIGKSNPMTGLANKVVLPISPLLQRPHSAYSKYRNCKNVIARGGARTLNLKIEFLKVLRASQLCHSGLSYSCVN